MTEARARRRDIGSRWAYSKIRVPKEPDDRAHENTNVSEECGVEMIFHHTENRARTGLFGTQRDLSSLLVPFKNTHILLTV